MRQAHNRSIFRPQLSRFHTGLIRTIGIGNEDLRIFDSYIVPAAVGIFYPESTIRFAVEIYPIDYLAVLNDLNIIVDFLV